MNLIHWNRRYVLQAVGAGTLGAVTGGVIRAEDKPGIKGRLQQSVCKWCYGKLPLEKLAEEVKKIGYRSIELLLPGEFEVVKKAGLTCAILGGASISEGAQPEGEPRKDREAAPRVHRLRREGGHPERHLHVRGPQRDAGRHGPRQLRDRIEADRGPRGEE